MCAGFFFYTKISQFQFTTLTDQQVLRFEVSVQDEALMDVGQTSQQLEQKKLDTHRRTNTRNHMLNIFWENDSECIAEK